MSIGELATLEFTSCLNTKLNLNKMQYQSISMQNRYFAYFSDVSHIGVDFRILICEFAYAWRPCHCIAWEELIMTVGHIALRGRSYGTHCIVWEELCIVWEELTVGHIAYGRS